MEIQGAIKNLEDVKTIIRVFMKPDYEEWALRAAHILDDTIAFLRTEKPRVMQLQELAGLDTVFVELKTTGEPVLNCAIINYDSEAEGIWFKPFEAPFSRTYLRQKEYGLTWRCWAEKPTDAQREAVKWDGETEHC